LGGLSFQYPAWMILLCVLLGLAYALVLYYRDKRFKEFGKWINRLLAILRFLTVTLLALLLLGPVLKSLETQTRKPVVVLLQDDSESVATAFKESETAEEYRSQYQGLKEALSQKYEVRSYVFGNEVEEKADFSFDKKVTDISDALQTVYDLYGNQNLGAVVLATDGIYNEGNNPLYQADQLAVPVFAVALGDTTAKRDLVLKRVFHNKIAYLGDRFSIQTDITAKNAAGENTRLTVYKVTPEGNQKLEEIPLTIDKQDFFRTEEIILDANSSGVQRYRLSLGRLSEESSVMNNSQDIFVDVLDARQKILLLANAPHPDITAIRRAITENKNYEVEVAYISDWQGKLEGFDLVILHQLPSRTKRAGQIFQQLDQLKKPRLFILGLQSNVAAFNQSQNLLSLNGDGRSSNEVQAAFAEGFTLFTLPDNIRKELPRFAPLTSPFGDYKEGSNGQVFLYQRIGKIDTKYPLLTFGEENGIKAGVLAAENIWKWRLFDFLQHQNHDIYNELMSKSIQYLTLQEDKRRFRISLGKNLFRENEPILMDAELYNESYELVNEPEVRVVITNGEGKDFTYTFNRTSNAYRLNAGFFPVGDYRFEGKVIISGQELTYRGQFSVQPIQLEAYETTADHALLKLISDKYGGQVIAPDQLSSLAQTINERDIKPVIYQTTTTRSVINLKWIFFLLLGLLVLEWFFRRYFGGY
jgi:hypothetical protein